MTEFITKAGKHKKLAADIKPQRRKEMVTREAAMGVIFVLMTALVLSGCG
jgi:hypothetical protein